MNLRLKFNPNFTLQRMAGATGISSIQAYISRSHDEYRKIARFIAITALSKPPLIDNAQHLNNLLPKLENLLPKTGDLAVFFITDPFCSSIIRHLDHPANDLNPIHTGILIRTPEDFLFIHINMRFKKPTLKDHQPFYGKLRLNSLQEMIEEGIYNPEMKIFKVGRVEQLEILLAQTKALENHTKYAPEEFWSLLGQQIFRKIPRHHSRTAIDAATTASSNVNLLPPRVICSTLVSHFLRSNFTVLDEPVKQAIQEIENQLPLISPSQLYGSLASIQECPHINHDFY